MNTMTTLFGGLAAVLVLYAAGGWVRSLHPMLRAVLAGVLPLITYFVLIVGQWPGLDVVAMHISVFLAAALVLYTLNQFRQRGTGRMHWAPKLLTGFFIGLVFLNAALLQISTKGLPEPLAKWWLGNDDSAVFSGFSGVVAHGENAAKAVSSELKETYQESQLGWQVEFSGLEGDELTRLISIRVKDRTGLPVDRVAAALILQRPGATKATLILPLMANEAGIYTATLSLPSPGRWLLELQIKQNGIVQFQNIQELVAS